MSLVCLTSLDDQDDQTVRTSYLNCFHPDFPSIPTAIAALLGAGEEAERSLIYHIADTYNKIKNEHWRNLELKNYDPGQLVYEDDGVALDYLETLALTWLHVWRTAQAGNPVPPYIFLPGLPHPSQWPPVAVPKAVYDSSRVVLPRDAIQRTLREDPTYGYDLYSDPPPKPVVPPPVPRDTQYELAVDREIVVRESDGDVDTEIDINSGDRVVFDAQGEIWAGVWPPSNNGPEGWWNIDTDRKFPLPGWHPYGLLGKLGVRYFPIGRHYGYPHHTPTYDGETPRLYLRINDDLPGNGSGQFTCHIQVWREKPKPHLKADNRKLISLETLPGVQTFEVAVRNEGAQPLAITDCRISPTNMQSAFQMDLPPGGVTVGGCANDSLRGTFRPTTLGVYSANLEIISNDPSGVFPNVALFGFAGPPQAIIRVAPLQASLRPGSRAMFTVANQGNRLLSIRAITIRENQNNTSPNAFSVEAQTPRVLNFQESFRFSVSYNPSSTEPTSDDEPSPPWQCQAQVLIDSDADNGPHPFPVELQGLPPVPAECEELASELANLQEELRTARGAAARAAIMQQMADVRAQMRQLGCGEHNG